MKRYLDALSEERSFERQERAYRAQERSEHMEKIGAGHSLPWRCEFWDCEDLGGVATWPAYVSHEYQRWWSRNWRMYSPIGAKNG